MSTAVQTSQSSTTSPGVAVASANGKKGTTGNSKTEQERKTPTSSSKPIQWATSTGATVLQHLAATREQQQKIKNAKYLTSNDLINSKPIASTSSTHTPAAAKGFGGSSTSSSSTAAKAKSTNGASSSSTGSRPPASLTSGTAKVTNLTQAKKDNTSGEEEVNGAEKKPARRRKANRACSHCQRAHLTCEDQRPCERCIKKGLADSCTDGARKKAKYLLDDDELLELKREKERRAQEAGSLDHNEQGVVHDIDALSQQDGRLPSLASSMVQDASWDPGVSATGPMPLGSFGPQQHSEADLYGQLSSFSPSSAASGVKNTFGSENASLEYSILSSMLNGIDPTWLSGSPDQQANAETDVGNVLNNGAFSHMGIDSMPWQVSSNTGGNVQNMWKEALRPAAAPQAVAALHHLDATLAMGGGATPNGEDVTAYDALEVPSPSAASAVAAMEAKQNGSSPASALTNTTEQEAQKSKAAAAAAAAGLDHKPDAVWRERVKHIYGDKTRPFPYTEGYHFLIKYVTANLDKADVLRIVRALAIFRPSLIALQMPMTEDDEIFVERSIQRTILEFEKLISFSGTPTVVWRRTCEVVVVGAEFSMLTQWSKEYLMGRYIYEFFEKPSILEYWEKFAAHAFENTAQSIMMPVTLRTSAGTTTRCAACFSIKRDIFDLPSLIVGNFLPILS